MSAKRSIAILALLPALLAAQQADSRVKVVEPTQLDQSLPSISLLPVGAVLRDVMIPRYDKNRQLTSCLRSSQITLIDPDTIETRKVHLEFFGPERARRGFVDVLLATYNQKTGVLKSTETVDIKSERFSANGSGLYYHLRTGKGFLAGPVTTISQGLAPQPSTSMKLSPKSTAVAAAAAAVIATSAHAEPPARLTPEQTTALQQDARSATDTVKQAAADAQQQIEDGKTVAAQTQAETREFIKEAGITTSEPTAVATAPLEIKADPTATTIDAKDGMYFDAEKGVLVFLKDVVVKDPRFQITGAQEVKVYFDQMPKEEKPKEEKPDKAKTDGDNAKNAKEKKTGDLFTGGKAQLGDATRIIASGQVLIRAKSTRPGEQDVEACAAVFDINLKTGEAVMYGGFPWVRQGDRYFRAGKAEGMVRFPNINKDISFVTQGSDFDMGLSTQDLQMDKKEKKDDKPKAEHAR